jgi:hypothetical protein
MNYSPNPAPRVVLKIKLPDRVLSADIASKSDSDP